MYTNNILNSFYEAFARGDADAMLQHYHPEVVFEDPAFGILKGAKAHAMWRMLLARSSGNLKIQYEVLQASKDSGQVHWVATYPYGPKKRPVINKVQATFILKDDKIIKHTDNFNFWKWTRQALGLPGYLLGWTLFLKNKVRKMTNTLLEDFMKRA